MRRPRSASTLALAPGGRSAKGVTRFDLAIRLGPLPDSTLRGRRIARFGRVTCAAPSFIARHGSPRQPAALADLPCLLYGNGPSEIFWTFRKASGEAERVAVRGPVRSNNLELLAALATRGHGAVRLPDWAVRDALSDGRLVEILPAWKHELERGALFALHPDDPGRAVLRHTFLSALEAMAHV